MSSIGQTYFCSTALKAKNYGKTGIEKIQIKVYKLKCHSISIHEHEKSSTWTNIYSRIWYGNNKLIDSVIRNHQ